MKYGLYHATAVAAGTLALSVALQNNSVSDFIVDGALTGGGLQAMATASIGNFGQSPDGQHQ
jgi:succinate dehydrogenase/fumarate reductase flavoprotein subunit